MSSGPALEMCAYNQEISTGAAEETSLNLPSQIFSMGAQILPSVFTRHFSPDNTHRRRK